MSNLKASDKCLASLMTVEELRLQSYQDVAGNWTIGYGHMAFPAGPGQSITMADALRLFKEDVAPVEDFINHNLMINSQNKFDALVSLIFNLGIGNFSHTLCYRLVKADPENLAIAFEWVEIIKSGGKRYRGLLLRRLSELQLYFSS
ncbi:MAG: lysozyme [Bacteroidales bacterium]|nr:lysozyme [Bacteroidales bacterium]